MINEIDCLAAFSKGCIRAILLGNDKICQSLFLLNPPASDRSLFGRSNPVIYLTEVEKKERKKEIIFIDCSDSKETNKKDSYTNMTET